MYILWKQRAFLFVIACCITCVFSACMPNISPGLNSIQLALMERSSFKSAPSHNHPHAPGRVPATRMPIVQTSCPSPARAAVRVPFNGGARQNLVYSYNTGSNGVLIRYDVSSRKKKTLLTLDNVTISNAQLSTDGHFILFVTQVSGQLAIQMVRIDGQALQTLYCAPDSKGPVNFIDDLLWSPDQQQVLFRVPDPVVGKTAPMLQLLNLTNGLVQTVFAPSGETGYIPRAWSGSDLVYMQGYALANSDTVPPYDVYVLEIAHKSVRQVALISGYDWDLSLTPNGRELLLGQGAALPPQGQPLAPSFISAQVASGGVLHVIYASHVHAVTQVRAISANTLLFVLGGRFAAGAYDGLWRINMNGSGLMQLTKDGKLLSDQHTVWSDISRDGHFYAIAGYASLPNSEHGQTTILYGSLNGGAVTVVDTTDVSDNAEVVGWAEL